jgi:tetratricopeptide (TPR) repeat protein
MQETCEHFELQMPDALTGQLEAAAQSGLQEHLAACEQCRLAFERFEKTAALLDRTREDSANSALWQRIERTVASGANRRAKLIRLNSSMAPFAVAAAMVAAALLLVIAMPPASSRLVSSAKVARVQPETSVVVAPARPARERFDDARGLALLRRMGPLAVFDAAHQAWRPIVPGERVPYGSRLRTGPGARAELAFGESRVRLDESSEVTISRAADRTRTAELAQGRVRVDLLRSDARFFMQSGGGRVELTGTIVELAAPAPRLAMAKILEGHVHVAPMIGGSNSSRIEAQSGSEVLVAYDASAAALRTLPDPLQKRAQALAEAKERVLPAQNGESGNWAQPFDQPPPKSEAAVGQLVVKDAQGHEAEPLGIVSFDIHANVRGPEALTRVEQVFKNETNSTLEGTFYFPLPPGAAISRFAMWVDEKTLVEGEVVERQQARAIYESILRQKRDPALLEWMEGNLFKARIFPIAPRSEKKIILEYTQLLPAFFETRSYVFPLVSELTQKTPIGRLSLRVDLDSGDGSVFSDVASPSYFAQTKVSGVQSSRVTASLEMRDLKPSADFVLTFSALRPSELTAAAYAEKDEDPYLLLAYQPQWQTPDNAAAQLPRDVLFVVETSGARTTQDLEMQRRVLEAMLAGLNASDRAAIAAADVALLPLSDELTPPQSRQNTAAFAALKSRVPLGALDLDATLRGAGDFLARESMAGRERFVIFLGAGVPALGTFDAGQLAVSGAASLVLAKAKFVAVGIGRSVETLTLSELARRSGGFFAPMLADENGDEAAFRMALNLSAPRLESAALKCDAAVEIYPAQLGALLPGQEVFAFTRLDRKKFEKEAPITVSACGQIQSQPFSQKMRVKLPADLSGDPAVGRFWARARMDALMAQPQSETVRTQIIDLAQTWTLLSPYTSFLVLESEAEYGRYNIDRKKRRKVWREDSAPVANAITEINEDNVGFTLRVSPATARGTKGVQFEERLKAAQFFYDQFDFDNARQELEAAVKVKPEDPASRELLTKVNDVLTVRRDRVRSATQQLAGEMKVSVQEKLIELDNRIDWGKRYIHEAQTDTELPLGERVRRYDQALNAFERAGELLKWMPVEVSAEAQEEEVKRLIGETRKATTAAQVRLQDTDREAAGRLAEEQRMSEKKYVEKKVRLMVDQGKALFETGKYDEALTIAAKVLEIDPTNADANTIVVVSRDQHYARKQKWLEEEYREAFTLNRERSERMNIPHSDYLIYPDNWKEIASRSTKGKPDEAVPSDTMKSKMIELERAERVKVTDEMLSLAHALEDGRVLEEKGSAEVKEDNVEQKHHALDERLDSLRRAQERYRRVREILNWMPPSLELPGMRAQIDTALQRTKGKLEAKEDEVSFLRREEAARTAYADVRREDAQFKARVDKLMGQVDELFGRNDFRAAEKLALSVLKIDPLNDKAEAMKKKARAAFHARENEDVSKLLQDEYKRSWEDVTEGSINYAPLVLYPSNWDAISKRAESTTIGKVEREEPWKGEIRRKLQRKIDFEFVDTPLDEAVSFLRGQTGATFIVDPSVVAQGAPKINLRVNDMSSDLALEWILKLSDLEYSLKDNAIVIGKPASLQNTVELQIVDISDLTHEIADFPGPEIPGEAAKRERGTSAPKLTASKIAELVRNRIQPESWDPAMGTSIEERGGKLVITQRPEVQEAVKKVLAELRHANGSAAAPQEGPTSAPRGDYFLFSAGGTEVSNPVELEKPANRDERILRYKTAIDGTEQTRPGVRWAYGIPADNGKPKPGPMGVEATRGLSTANPEIEVRDTPAVLFSAQRGVATDPLLYYVPSSPEETLSPNQETGRFKLVPTPGEMNRETLLLRSAAIQQQQAVAVNREIEGRARDERLALETELNALKHAYVTLQRDKQTVEQDLSLQSRRLERLLALNVPITALMNEDPTATQPYIPDAQVLAVKPDTGVVMISAGSNQGVTPGYQFTIARGDDQYVSKVQVDRVYPDMSSGKVIVGMQKREIEMHDRAIGKGEVRKPDGNGSAAETRGERTAIVPLTREQILQLLKLTPKTDETAQTRVQLVCTLASVSDGAEVYRVFVTGIADFGGTGQHAERLAQEFLGRLTRETSKEALDAALKFVEDSGLRARMFARRANLESDAAQRSDFFERAYFESERESAYLQPLCESLLAAQRYKALSDYIEDALRRGAGASWQWPLLAKAYDAQKLPQQALRALTQDAALRPREPEPRLALAKTFDGLGRGAEALRELRAACDLKPEVVGGYRELAVLAKKYGDRAAREWALLKMLNGTWLSTDGNVWGEASRGLEELLKEYDLAGKSEAAAALREAVRQAKIKDIEVVLSWDTDGTDVDLHVAEPGGMEVNYQRKSSPRGGVLDRDETNGRGPETYTLKRADAGTYAIKVVYYNGTKPTLASVKVTEKAGSPGEKSQTFTIPLEKSRMEKDVYSIKIETK